MSRLFGPIRQCGIVVASLDEAFDHWIGNLGIGPFFRISHIPLESFEYRGKGSPVDLSVAFANSGDMQIELIEQHNSAPSPYRDFLDRHGPGLQHYSVWSAAYDQDMKRLSARDVRILASGVAGNGTRFAYFAGADDSQPIMEIADLSAASSELFDMIREEAARWDGSDPVRSLTLS